MARSPFAVDGRKNSPIGSTWDRDREYGRTCSQVCHNACSARPEPRKRVSNTGICRTNWVRRLRKVDDGVSIHLTGLIMQDTPSSTLRRRRTQLVRQMPVLETLLRGSLVERYKRCGKPGCKC